nr:ADP-ribosylglycohydrolase family protein [Streptomyces sp. DSM 41633]
MTAPAACAPDSVRLTWAQPEDLVGHELRQAAEDGRNPEPARRTWLAAGGGPAPERDGASPTPAAPELRALAVGLLDELAAQTSPLAAAEPQPWKAIVAACPDWPPPPAPAAEQHPVDPAGQDRAPTGHEPSPHPAAPATTHDPARTGHDAQRRPRATGQDRDPGGPTPHSPGSPAAQHREPGGHGLSVHPAIPAGHDPRTRPEAARQDRPDADAPAGQDLRTRLEAAWLGRAVGCLLGKPVEKLPLEGIRALARATGNWPLNDWFSARGVPPELLAAHPWNRRSAPTSLAENIDGMPEDDDLNYPLLGLLLLQRHGKGFTTADVARLWLDELPAGRTFTAERIAYRNLLLGLEPPATATHHNPFREWIGALIRADVHGWTNPGDPAAAAAQAYRDAVLTHTGNGVYAALFIAAATAEAATGRADVHTALRAGLAVVPPRSRLAEAVRLGIRAASDEADFDLVVDRLHARFGHYHWVHAVPNTALIAAALTHADGDFTRSVCRAVSGGWDTDSNGATAGALAALVAGSPGALPHRWTAPLKNRLATTVPGFDGIGFDTLAHLTAQEAARS